VCVLCGSMPGISIAITLEGISVNLVRTFHSQIIKVDANNETVGNKIFKKMKLEFLSCFFAKCDFFSAYTAMMNHVFNLL